MEMLEWICHNKPNPSHWHDSENVPFTNAEINRFVRGALASLKSSVVALFCMPELTVEPIISELRN